MVLGRSPLARVLVFTLHLAVRSASSSEPQNPASQVGTQSDEDSPNLFCTPDVHDRNFHARNMAGLYAIGATGTWIRVTNFDGSLNTSLHEINNKSIYDPSLKRVVIYAHGRNSELGQDVNANRAFTDGFCRGEVHSDEGGRDYAGRLHKAGWNTLLWYWSQYSYNACGLPGNVNERSCDKGVIVSTKIWKDRYLRTADSADGSGMGNPLWAKFIDAQTPTDFNWAETFVADNRSDPTELAVGHAFAKSLMNVADSLATVESLHFVGNSYGSQVVLHGSYLILEQLKSSSQFANLPSPPLPTRLILLDPAYPRVTELGPRDGQGILPNLAIPQLEKLHAANIPVLTIQSTGISNGFGFLSPVLGGQIATTSGFTLYGLTVRISMFDFFDIAAHTAVVDWYFDTYNNSASNSDPGVCTQDDLPDGAKAIMFGCTSDAEAWESVKETLEDPEGIDLLQQKGRDNDPWNGDWEAEQYCTQSGRRRTCMDKLRKHAPLLYSPIKVDGCTQSSRAGSRRREGQFKCVFPAPEWDQESRSFPKCGGRKTLTHNGETYSCEMSSERESAGSLCKAWCSNTPVEGCTAVIHERGWFTSQFKCIFPKGEGGCNMQVKHGNKTFRCGEAEERDSNDHECKIRCDDDGVPAELFN